MTRFSYFFFFNDTATTEIYTLSLHDALPIFREGERHVEVFRRLVRHVAVRVEEGARARLKQVCAGGGRDEALPVSRAEPARSEEHTSELQSRQYLVCRLLLEKKKNKITQSLT